MIAIAVQLERVVSAEITEFWGNEEGKERKVYLKGRNSLGDYKQKGIKIIKRSTIRTNVYNRYIRQ